MDPATVMSHEALILAGITISLTVIGMCGAAAWAGAKMALRSVKTEIGGVKDLYNAEINNIKISQLERKAQILALWDDVKTRVPQAQCQLERIECGNNRTERICLISTKIESLFATLESYNEKRELARKENGEMYLSIQIKLSELTSVTKNLSERYETMEKFIMLKMNPWTGEPK